LPKYELGLPLKREVSELKNSKILDYGLKIITVGVGISCIVVGIHMIYRNLQITIGDTCIPSGLILLIVGVVLIALGIANQTSGRKSSRKLSQILLDIVLPIVIIFLVVSAGFYLFSRSKAIAEIANTHTVLRDVLQIVLGVAAVAIAVLGYAIYQIVAQRLRIYAEEEIGSERRRTTAQLYTYVGFLRSTDFESSTPRNPGLLEDAIEATERAHIYASELDQRDPKNERILGTVRNNLAWYLARRGRTQDRGRARGYAEYLHLRSGRFPEEREEWEHTYKQVMRVYP